jgi:uncharacterized coiled-coil DUF342 family protein
MFALISKSRGEIEATIPAAQGSGDITASPVVVTIKNCLDQINDIGIKKDEIMAEGVAMHEQLNAIEELMKCAQGHAQKAEVFDSYKEKYIEHFAKNKELEQQRQNISQVIAQNGPALQGILSQSALDPAKTAYFN